MPRMLLALVTISVWILFVVGCLGLLIGIVGLVTFWDSFRMGSAFGLGIFSLILSVIAAWFRQQLC
jgi:hypothetical protein